MHLMVKRIGKIIKGLRSLSRDGESDPFVAFNVLNMIEDVNMLVEMKARSHDINFDIIVSDPALQSHRKRGANLSGFGQCDWQCY